MDELVELDHLVGFGWSTVPCEVVAVHKTYAGSSKYRYDLRFGSDIRDMITEYQRREIAELYRQLTIV